MRSQAKKQIQEMKQPTPKGRGWRKKRKRRTGMRKNGKTAYDPKARPVEEIIAEIAAKVPAEEWERVPKDASVNLDHYLYGAPKRQ